MTRVAIASGLSAAILGGCVGPLARKPVPGKDEIQRLSVPYTIGDPVVEQSGPRLRLAASQFMVVDPGPEPRLLGRVLVEGEAGFAEIDEAAFGRIFHEGHDRAPVDASVLAAAGIEPPGDSVIVVSETAPCRAGIGEPAAELFADAPRHIEVTWALSGCEGEGLAPIAVLVDRLYDGVSWRPAVRTVDATLAPERTWNDPLGAETLLPEWTLDDPPDVAAIQVWQIADVDPTVVQVFRGLAKTAAEGADACAQPEAWMQTNGWWRAEAACASCSRFEPIEPGDDLTVAPQLVGALVHGTQVDAIVYRQRDAPLVLVPPATTEAGTTTEWATFLVDPGLVTPATTPRFSWSMVDRETAWRRTCE